MTSEKFPKAWFGSVWGFGVATSVGQTSRNKYNLGLRQDHLAR